MTDTHPLEEIGETWPEALDHISATSVKMAARCPEQWRQRYVHGKRIPPVANLLLGRADHRAIEESMRQKITSHVDLDIYDVLEYFLAAVDEEVELEGGLGEVEVQSAKKDVIKGLSAKRKRMGELKMEAHNLVGQYHNKISPTLQPVLVEEEFVLKPKSLPVRVEGRVDLVVEGVDRAQRLIDRKRTGSVRTQPEWSIQAEVYQLAFPVPHDWHLSVTTKGGYVVVPDAEHHNLTQPVGPERRAWMKLEHLCAEIGHYYNRYGPDEPWPAKGTLHPWACGYCGYRKECWAWQET